MKGLRLFLWLAALTGIIYPFFILIIAKLTFHDKAEGSLIKKDHQVIGSAFIGQPFASDRYFWPRPSAIDYNPLPSGGSDLAPTSAKLRVRVDERRAFYLKEGYAVEEIPSELLYASASGLDPHISMKAALFQLNRVAHARKIPREKIHDILLAHFEKRRFGVLGQPRVNVLRLNLALDDEEAMIEKR